MKTVIIPVDFSETALNASRYAAQMLAGKDVTMILYNMFEDEKEAETSESYLKSLREEMKGKGVSKVEFVKESGDDLIENLSRLAFQKAATLIVMGITGKSAIKQIFMG